jgi:hypothetical protein
MGDLVWKGAERRTAGAKALPLRLSMARLNPCPSLSVCAFSYRRPRSDGAADGNPGISLVFREMCDSTVQTPSFLLGIRDQMVDLGAILLHGTHADPGHGKQG